MDLVWDSESKGQTHKAEDSLLQDDREEQWSPETTMNISELLGVENKSGLESKTLVLGFLKKNPNEEIYKNLHCL